MPRVWTLLEYFAQHPPTHIVASALAGIKPRRRRARVKDQGGGPFAEAFASMVATQVAGLPRATGE